MSTNLCMDRTFGKTPALSEFGINSGHFFVKLHNFVKFPNFSPKNRPALGDYKLEVLTQHIFVVGGGLSINYFCPRFSIDLMQLSKKAKKNRLEIKFLSPYIHMSF